MQNLLHGFSRSILFPIRDQMPAMLFPSFVSHGCKWSKGVINWWLTESMAAPEFVFLPYFVLRFHQVMYDSAMIDGQRSNNIHTPARAQTQSCGETDDPTSIWAVSALSKPIYGRTLHSDESTWDPCEFIGCACHFPEKFIPQKMQLIL
jgi:hypothetical protein